MSWVGVGVWGGGGCGRGGGEFGDMVTCVVLLVGIYTFIFINIIQVVFDIQKKRWGFREGKIRDTG